LQIHPGASEKEYAVFISNGRVKLFFELWKRGRMMRERQQGATVEFHLQSSIIIGRGRCNAIEPQEMGNFMHGMAADRQMTNASSLTDASRSHKTI
jgi:hypothetical protein